MPAHACRPISHAWLKNVSCCRLAWHNFQKYVNSDPCKERKPGVKWINDNTFLAISDFYQLTSVLVDKGFLDNFAFGRLRTSSEDFRLLRESLEWSCHLQKFQHSQDKNLTLISQKKLAGIISLLFTHFSFNFSQLLWFRISYFLPFGGMASLKSAPLKVQALSPTVHCL